MEEGFAIAAFLLNDWPIRRFCIVSLSLQCAFVGLVSDESMIRGLVFLRGLIGFVILTVVPGFCTLRIMKLHDLEPGRTIMFAVGLSLSFVMAVGLFATIVSSLIGLEKPMTSGPFLLMLNVGLLLLLSFAYARDRNFKPSPNLSSLSGGYCPSLLIALFLLLLGVLGTSIANARGGNMIQMVFILCVSIFPVAVAMWRTPRGLNSVTIFLLSLALTYHVSLFTPYVTGTDIFGEYYYANLTLVNGYWDSNALHPLSAALSITILPAAFQMVSNIDVNLYFKVIAPLFFSLVPTGLFLIYRKALGDKMTGNELFYAVFLFISIWQFYSLMSGIIRQQLGELFYVMLFMLLLDRGDHRVQNSIPLVLVFSAALIVSHYTLANLFLLFMLFTVVLVAPFGKGKKIFAREISFNYLVLFIVLSFAWYMYIGRGSVFNNMSHMATSILSGFSSFFEPSTNVAVGQALSSSTNIAHDIFRLVYYAIAFLLLVGVIRVSRGVRSGAGGPTLFYYRVCLSNYIMLFLVSFVPFLGYQLGFDRTFHVVFLVLAPLPILAFKDVIRALSGVLEIPTLKTRIGRRESNFLLAMFLSIVLLFGSGLIYAVTDDPYPSSVPLSESLPAHLMENESRVGQALLKVRTVSAAEIAAAIWLESNRQIGEEINAGLGCNELTSYSMLYESTIMLLNDNLSTIKGYFYYGSLGKIYGIQIIKPGWQVGVVSDISSFDVVTSGAGFDRVYSGSMSDVYSSNSGA